MGQRRRARDVRRQDARRGGPRALARVERSQGTPKHSRASCASTSSSTSVTRFPANRGADVRAPEPGRHEHVPRHVGPVSRRPHRGCALRRRPCALGQRRGGRRGGGVLDRPPGRRRQLHGSRCSRRCSSPTSSARRTAPVSSAMPRGAGSSTPTTTSCERSSHDYGGRGVDTTGDGFFATFDGPARALRCAAAIVEAGPHDRARDPRRRAHRRGDASRRRVCRDGRPHRRARDGGRGELSEVVTTSTVRDLVIGSGLEFDDRGVHTLKGVEGSWQLVALRT